MNVNKINTRYQKNSKRNVRKAKPSYSNVYTSKRARVPVNQSRSEVIGKAIERNIEKAQHLYEDVAMHYDPFSKYIHTLLHENSPKVLTPLTPFKAHLKRVYYQDTLSVNASGNAILLLQPTVLSLFGSSSTASPVLYCNETAYDPNAASQVGLTGGWNTNLVSALNINTSAFAKCRVAGVHIMVTMTGVSNLDKKGTIHLAQDTDEDYFYGTSSDTAQNEYALVKYSIQDLPRKTFYKSVEIVNMDSRSAIEYHYIPITNQDLTRQYNLPSTISTSSQGVYPNGLGKRFAMLIQGADTATQFKIRYQFDLECQVDTDYVNDYPPEWSRIFVDSEPTVQLLGQREDFALRVNQNEGHINNKFQKLLSLEKFSPKTDVVGISTSNFDQYLKTAGYNDRVGLGSIRR